jgi:hypothetical protein
MVIRTKDIEAVQKNRISENFEMLIGRTGTLIRSKMKGEAVQVRERGRRSLQPRA